MNLEELKFESPLDIAALLHNETMVRNFLVEFFDNSEKLFRASEGKYISVVRNKDTAFYNIDFDLLVFSFIGYAEKLEILSTNAIANIKNLLSKTEPTVYKKVTLFLVNVLAFYNVTPQPKGNYYYVPILHKKEGSDVYFQFNSIGLSRTMILEVLGKEIEEEFILPISINTKDIPVIHLGVKAIGKHKKIYDLRESALLTFGNVLPLVFEENE